MSLYLRKSVKVGPLRFNLSKSGIGVSGGIRGLRLGTGPRGNYVHMGRNGLYYRKTFSKGSPLEKTRQTLSSGKTPIQRQKAVELEEIESRDVSAMVDSSSEELLQELNEKRKKSSMSPIAAIAAGAALFLLWRAGTPGWALGLTAVVGAAGVYFASLRDRLSKTAVLFYELDPDMEKAYEALHAQASVLANCNKTWHIEAQGAVTDRKYHAGASHLVRRKKTNIRTAEPPYVKTNISTVSMGVGRQTLHFFPDRLLIFDTSGVGAVGYKELRIETESSRFIEEEGVPFDAKVVDKTWKYVNKRGGPDKRFKDNRELPVCLYDQIDFTSSTGLNERIQVSRCDVAEGFREAVAALAAVLP